MFSSIVATDAAEVISCLQLLFVAGPGLYVKELLFRILVIRTFLFIAQKLRRLAFSIPKFLMSFGYSYED